MEYAVLFLPLAGALLGYLGKSLTKFFCEITTSLFTVFAAVLSFIIFYNGFTQGQYGNYKKV